MTSKAPKLIELVPPRPRRLRVPLRTAAEVQREMAKCYRALATGQLSANEASVRARLLSDLGKLIAAAVNDDRVNKALKRLERLDEHHQEDD